MKVEVAAVALLKNISNLLGESDFSKCAKTLLLVWKKSENCKIYFHKIIFLRLFSENHSLIGSFSYREFLLHKKFGRAIFFSYREFSLTRSSLIGSFDCISIIIIDDVNFLFAMFKSVDYVYKLRITCYLVHILNSSKLN